MASNSVPQSTKVRLGLKIALALLMVDSILELAFVSSMVGWLHQTASGIFFVNNSDGSFPLKGEPANLLVDQGHTSNGAAGTAFVLIGCGGIIALFLRGRAGYHRSFLSKAIYRLWVALNVPALLLTLGALAFVFALTSPREGQTIDLGLAEGLQGNSKYPRDSWTPQNWFSAVLDLDVADAAVRSDIALHLRLMRAWQYNLIPMFVIQFVQTTFALFDARDRHREAKYAGVEQYGGIKA